MDLELDSPVCKISKSSITATGLATHDSNKLQNNATRVFDIRQQFDTNLFGAISVTRAVLPILRKQRSGHILNISSANGIISFAGVGIYSATKFALEAVSEALAQEVKPLGIKVTLIEPGSLRTEFSGRVISTLADQIADRITDYAQTSGKNIQRLQERDGKQPGDPVKVAAAMIQVVESDNPRSPACRRCFGGSRCQSSDRRRNRPIRQD
jgi:short-subunit dehydrogenase